MALKFSHPLITIFVALLALGLSHTTQAGVSRRELQITKSKPLDRGHKKWTSSHRRVYKDPAEKERRQKIFNENSKFIEKFNNQADRTFKLRTNKFADLTNQEFHQKRTGGFKLLNLTRTTSAKLTNELLFSQSLASQPTPARVDWREKNAVTPVKEQGYTCGSCWAFSSVATVETLMYIKTGRLPSLSEQQLVDCIREGYSIRGCKGGNHNEAFAYIAENGGMATESNYPYTAKDGSCRAVAASQKVADIRGYVELPANNEAALRYAVSRRPVSAFMDTSGKEFQFYDGGVFDGDCGTTLDHSVAVVGYGTTREGVDYWLLKNSWGKDWGEGGYMRLLRNSGDPQGKCGIAMYASYPTM